MAVMLHGAGASPGLAWGKVLLWQPVSGGVPSAAGPVGFQDAVVTVHGELQELQRVTAGQAGGEVAAIFGAQALMVTDPELAAEVEARVVGGLPLATAIHEAGEALAALFDALADEYLRQRAADVRDVAARLVAAVTGREALPPIADRDTILVTTEIAPSVVAKLDPARVKAIVTTGGGTTSHAALLAKGLGIPAVFACADALTALATGDVAAVDGAAGLVLGRPTPDEEAAFRTRVAEEEERKRQNAALRDVPAVTVSGRRILVGANVTGAREAQAAAAAGADGVGLFRTEFLFLDRPRLPGEAEQFAEYRAVLAAMAPHPVVIRTLDIGGDKPVPGLALPREENPFLGWRGIRLWLERPDLAVPQTRALLRAARYGNLQIMLPMVADVSEVQAARRLIEQVRADLGELAGPYQLGIMIEVPAAALDAERLSAEVDFFSIGTNDLVQYTMAADRGNQKVAAVYNPLHPSVLKLIEMTVRAGQARGIWTGVCGSVAGDPKLLPLLVAMGVDELSVPPAAVGEVKRQVRSLP